MKSILMSIRPEWAAKILNGEKTIEVRKTMPKCDLPIDVYIYCTKGKKDLIDNREDHKTFFQPLNGKVVAKFTLNKVEEISSGYYVSRILLFKSCLNQKEMSSYLKGKVGYAWHIDNLVIFDEPKELSEFRKYCNKYFGLFNRCLDCKAYTPDLDLEDYCAKGKLKLTKAPQSWQFIETEE